MNISEKPEQHQIDCSLPSELVLMALARYEDFVSPVDLAMDLNGSSVAIVKQRLKELGDAVENDGGDGWRTVKNRVGEGLPHVCSLDEKELLEIEDKISQITEAFFVKLGGYLKQIRDRGLYKTRGYKSFAKYCSDRFGYGRTQVHHIIAAAEVVNNLKSEIVHRGEQFLLPTSERQVRHLAKLKPDEQVEVWTKAIENNSGKIPTGGEIEKIVRNIKHSRMELPKPYNVRDSAIELEYPKLEIDSKYGRIKGYLISIKDEKIKEKIEQYARKIGAATIEGAIARLLEQIEDE